jgi:hypothetical protein
MELDQLRARLDELIESAENAAEIKEAIADLRSFFPFNEFEFRIAHLLSAGRLDLDGYLDMRDEYIDGSPYLNLYELSPAPFGKVWAEQLIRQLVPDLKKPAKGDKDAQHHDWMLDGIRVEVKASRAVDQDSTLPLVQKALSLSSTKPFEMNFQQQKPGKCDVFVWIGVWRDWIRYWVLSSAEVAGHGRFSDKQHAGNKGEGQLHITDRNIKSFDGFEAASDKLAEAIRAANERQG